jgi:adenylate cyclase, class 2
VAETEIKLRMAGPVEAREAVSRIGAVLKRARHFEDNLLFDDAAGSLRKGGNLLRLRRTEPGASVLTFKGARSVVEGIRSREEFESEVADGDAVETIIRALGFRPAFRYQKYRESHSWRDVEIVVDETPIGTFLEVEGPLPTIHAAARALGFGTADYVTDSYAGLFAAAGGSGDMVFRDR